MDEGQTDSAGPGLTNYYGEMIVSPTTVRTLFAVFLIAHALMTMSLATVPVPQPGALRTPFFPGWWRTNIDPLWPVARLGISPAVVQTAGWVLWLAASLLLALAGIGLLGLPGLNAIWQGLAVGGAVVSLLLLGLYWHPWLVVGILLNLGIVAGVWAGWFTRWFAGK